MYAICLLSLYVSLIGMSEKTQSAVVGEEGPEPECCLGHSKTEWLQLANCCGSGVLAMFGIVFWDKCPAIEGLNWYLLIFGVNQIATILIKFQARLFHDSKDLATETAKAQSAAKKVADCCGILSLGVAVWGAVLVYPNTEYFSAKEGECEGMYVPAFVATTIVITIFAALLLFAVVFFGFLGGSFNEQGGLVWPGDEMTTEAMTNTATRTDDPPRDGASGDLEAASAVEEPEGAE